MLLKEKKRLWHLSQSEMSFRKESGRLFLNFCLISFSVLFMFSVFRLTAFGLQETVDRIVAVVNGEVITLTDLRIVSFFGLFEEEDRSGIPLSVCLERMIDQKLVIQLSPEAVDVEKKELEEIEARLKERMGEERIKEAFQKYGLSWTDLREYIRERVLFKSLISRKFGQAVTVSLEEIEAFYEQSYVPSQRKKGLEPRPMMEMIQEIESLIRQNKMKKRVMEWISSLRKRADIQVRLNILDRHAKSWKEKE